VRAKGLNIARRTNTQAIFDELRNQFARTQPDDIFFHGHRLRHYSDTSPHRSADAG